MEVKEFNEKEGRNRLKVEVECYYCGKKFLKDKRYTHGKSYCKEHINKDPNKRKEVKCEHCGKLFSITLSRFNRCKSKLFFCSKTCKAKEQRVGGKIDVSSWCDGKSDLRGFVFSKKECRCENCGYDTHKPLIEIHHIDSNRKNNEIENLAVLCTMCHRAITVGLAELDADHKLNWK